MRFFSCQAMAAAVPAYHSGTALVLPQPQPALPQRISPTGFAADWHAALQGGMPVGTSSFTND